MNFHAVVRLFQDYRTPLLTALLIISLLGLFTLIDKHHAQQEKQWLERYAAIISQLSNTALAVTIGDNNLISLQSQLNELIQSPKIVNGVIYDVNNQILVQAGDVLTNSDSSQKTFTTPITLDNSVIGSLTLQLRHDDTTPTGWWLAFATMALLLLPLSLLLWTQYRQRQPAAKPTNSIDHEKPSTQWHTQLLLHINSLDKMYQQLNAEARQQQLEQLQSTLNKVVTLYSGKPTNLHANGLLLQFSADDATSALFNAICCGYLLKNAHEKHSGLIKLTLAVTHCQQHNHCSLEELPVLKSILTGNINHNQLLLNTSLLGIDRIADRLQLETTNGQPFVVIEGFNAHYRQLLDNQLALLDNQ